ncbi:MAG: M3 family metallopeptidase [Candidatus Absconditabacteria bacterium]|nr:M3 family metallopeptidase [Candidatus Absconditabacteria bacterium]
MTNILQTERSFDAISPNVSPEFRLEQRKETEKIIDAFCQKREHNANYLHDATTLKEALDDYQQLQGGLGEGGSDFGVIGAESYYYYLQKCIHSDDEAILSAANQADDFATKMQNKKLFFELSLTKIAPEQQTAFLSSPLLIDYKHFLEKLFREAKHVLSDAEEKIINIMSKTSYENRAMMTQKMTSALEGEITHEGKTEKKSFEELLTLTSDANEELRTQAAQQANLLLRSLRPEAENEINSILEYKKSVDELRNFSYPEEASYLANDIDKEVVEAMSVAVVDSFEFSKGFYTLKAKLFGKNQLTYEEKNLEYGDLEKKYTREEAVQTVKETLKELDPEFLSIFEEFLKEGRIDVYPRKGKKGGAFCTDNSKNLPIYIMLNFTNKLDDLRTLIHEMGHGINAHLQRKQNAINYGAVISTAEVASTFFEAILNRKLSKQFTGEEALTFRIAKMDDMVRTAHRQIAGFRFEQELHHQFRQKGYLNATEIGSLFAKWMQAYTGEAMTFTEDNHNRWIYWSHFRYFFYVPFYASGILLSKAMESLLYQGKLSIDDIKTFLSDGQNLSPREIFLKMGIDIADKNFRKLGLEEMNVYLEDTIRLAKDLGKIQ